MSATVTYSDGATPLIPAPHPMDGDDRANVGHDGQLWERVAESAPDSLGALGQRVRTPSAPGFIATADRRGPRLNGGFKRNWAMTNTYRACASGIFHTGERVR